MVIISSRKFRDSQSEYFRKALEEEVILTTVHYGSFKLVPIIEGESGKHRTENKETVVMNNESAGKTHVGFPTELVQEKVTEENPKSESIDNETDNPIPEETSGIDKVEIKPHKSEVYVDPALYDAFPEEYAAELEAERKMIEELKYTGIRRFFHKVTKK